MGIDLVFRMKLIRTSVWVSGLKIVNGGTYFNLSILIYLFINFESVHPQRFQFLLNPIQNEKKPWPPLRLLSFIVS